MLDIHQQFFSHTILALFTQQQKNLTNFQPKMKIAHKSLYSESFTIKLSKFMIICWCGFNFSIPFFE